MTMRSLLTAGSALLFLFTTTASAEPAAVSGNKIKFKKTQLDDKFRSEGVAAGDYNHDGKLDIAAGAVYFAAPDWQMNNIIEKPETYDPKGYSNTFNNYSDDFNGDGWADLLIVGWPGQEARWYENPQTAAGPWKVHNVVRVVNNESPQYLSIDGAKQRVLLAGTNPDAANVDSAQRYMAIFTPGTDAKEPWTVSAVSEPNAPGTQRYSHGIGAGDVNKDGRDDILVTEGWWEAPAEKSAEPWKFHQAPFGEACSHMYAYDVDGDGDNDIITASAHKFGIWWHEQKADGWETHEISKSFSQTHALNLVDINGDGLKDLVTGKRWWAHAAGDPGVDEPAVLYWLELQRKEGKPSWVEHKIDDNSGVGTQFEVVDMNGDGLWDIISSNKKGTFYFEQVRE
jgi:hypothetical protein